MIKSRDFWMPFAPVIMKEYQNEYLVNPKKIEAPFMIITFDSTPRAHQDLRAAMHPYDKTLRPQVIDRTTNPSLYKILKEYRKLTGKSGLLNTSFNIHGDPIVCSPEDALKTFEKTGLKYLAMGNFLISKN
jgi:carbamoyltransferase